MARVSSRLPQVVQLLVEQDASADDIGRVVTAVGDAVERRLLALAEADLGAPPVPYCWVALGSRARLEQALAADQDNAIIVDDACSPEQLGVVRGARPTGDRTTSPRAGTRAAPATSWRPTPGGGSRSPGGAASSRHWLSSPSPTRVLGASIFFDMRPVHGDHTPLRAALQPTCSRRSPGRSSSSPS